MVGKIHTSSASFQSIHFRVKSKLFHLHFLYLAPCHCSALISCQLSKPHPVQSSLTLFSLLFLKHIEYYPASEPFHMLFLLPGILSPTSLHGPRISFKSNDHLFPTAFPDHPSYQKYSSPLTVIVMILIYFF